ncbi:MAG: lamin tail domain-containing protein [Candidatus Eisenbacteria sp.]|nr:lamin tail domain-containing protein [Candidatus Eisenbacteria bacterium]
MRTALMKSALVTPMAVATLAVLAILVASSLVTAQTLRIYHIDVNQADATLFVSPSGNTMLVDGGTRYDEDEIKAVMHLAGVQDIDHFVCTHYHADHTGSIWKLVEELGVSIGAAYDRGDTAFVSNGIKETGTYRNYQRVIGPMSRQLMRGESIPLDDAMSVRCLAHGGVVLGEEDPPTTGRNENDMSIALIIKYGSFHYFIGGDLEAPTEQKIAARDLVMDVDVYQSNHHGSDTSSSLEFMQDLSPTLIVISNGNDGGYEHPQQSTLDRYASLSGPPTVLQTNRYTEGGSGGNVSDAFIADLEYSGDEGMILVTVDASAGNYQVSYRDTTITFLTTNRLTAVPGLVIESLLPDPEGNATVERRLEEVTLRNSGQSDVSLTGWTLTDKTGRAWTLGGATVHPDESVVIVRNGMPMNLNNRGDRIYLRDRNDSVIDEFEYGRAVEGEPILTGH